MKGDGTGLKSIYVDNFADECFDLQSHFCLPFISPLPPSLPPSLPPVLPPGRRFHEGRRHGSQIHLWG